MRGRSLSQAMLRAVNWGDLSSSQLIHRGASGSCLESFSARTGP